LTTRPLPKRFACSALALAAALAAPAVAAAGDNPPNGGVMAPPPPATQGAITATGPQVTITARAGTMRGKLARVHGTAPAGRTVAIERFDDGAQAWRTLATAAVDSDGTYVARWRARTVGQFRIRAVLQSASEATAASASPELDVTVHRPAVATWYGPGFYGHKTACGVKMTRSLLGVAHKRLPCGTEVAVLYRGRRITVPVVDRGPFRHGTSYDLTAATAQALRFTHTARLGAVRLRAAE
jgi:rare lipoprotein A (peptidoglycan hydrolase)